MNILFFEMSEQNIQLSGLFFKINKKDNTAKVSGSYTSNQTFFIPKSIKYESQVYTVSGLVDDLGASCKFTSIIFADDSEITTIGNSFSCSNVKSIKFPPKLENLSEDWCSDTGNLVNIYIPSSNKDFQYLDNKMLLTKSDKNSETYDILVFARRDITKAIIPSFIKRINSSAFSECKSLTEIQFTENSELLSIGKNAFTFSLIENFWLPPKLETLEDNWCNHFSKLKNISISNLNENFKFLDENNEIVVGKSDKNSEVYDTLVIAIRDIDEVFIPSYIKHISSSAFLDCSYLQHVEFEENSELLSIGENAFFRCRLDEITIPKTVRTIGKSAFIDTEHMTKVEFDEDSELSLIDDNVFTGSGIQKVFIPRHVKRIGKFSFSGCADLTVVDFAPESELTSIGDSGFSYDSIREVFIPRHVQSIERFAFFQCPTLEKVEFEEGSELTSLGNKVFSDTSIESIVIPKGVSEIKKGTFMNNTNLKTVEFPEDSELTIIRSKAFVESSVESITFPPKVEKLENNWCNFTFQLTNLIISPQNKNFDYLDEEHKLVVGKSNNENDFFDVIVFSSRDVMQIIIPSFITRINSCAFSDCEFLEKVDFFEDSEVNSIGEGSFSGCALKNMVFPRKVSLVEQNAFLLCSNLNNVEFLSDSVTLGKDCFNNCTALFIISFPNAKKIYNEAFPFHFVSESFSLFALPNAEIIIGGFNNDHLKQATQL